MKKNAQVTFMIAISVFIVVIASFIFYVAYYFENKNLAEPLVFERLSIENYINGCVKKTAEDGLKLLGKQGGIILKEHLQTPNSGIDYYLYNNQSKIPSIENIQDELSFYVKSNLDACLRDFEDFKRRQWNVEKGEIETKTQVNEQDVAFEVNFPLKITNQGSTLNFERFVSKVNVRLKYIYDLANRTVNFNIKNPRSVDRTALSNYDVNVTVFPYEDSVVYVIDDSKSLIMNKAYRFMFAMGFE